MRGGGRVEVEGRWEVMGGGRLGGRGLTLLTSALCDTMDNSCITTPRQARLARGSLRGEGWAVGRRGGAGREERKDGLVLF